MPLKQLNVVEDLSIITEVRRKTSKWQVIRSANQRISPGQTKLIDLIVELQKSTNEENTEISQRDSQIGIKSFRRRLAHILQQRKFQYTIISLVLFDLLIILIELILGMFNKETSKQKSFSSL